MYIQKTRAIWHTNSVADPGFPREGRQSLGGQPAIWPFSPQNCMNMKKFWPRGGVSSASLDPSLQLGATGNCNGILHGLFLHRLELKVVPRDFSTDLSVLVESFSTSYFLRNIVKEIISWKIVNSSLPFRTAQILLMIPMLKTKLFVSCDAYFILYAWNPDYMWELY